MTDKLDTKISWLNASRVIQSEIGNRRNALADLHEKMVALQGEIRGLSEAFDRLERLEEAARKLTDA